MPDDMAGRFIKLLSIIMRGEEPVVDDFSLKMALHPFIAQLKRDSEKYSKICERNRKNGEKGGRPRNNPENPNGLYENPENPNQPKKADNDNDNDKGNDNDIINNTVKKTSLFNGDVGEVFSYWQETMNHKRARLDDKRKKKIIALFKILPLPK